MAIAVESAGGGGGRRGGNREDIQAERWPRSALPERLAGLAGLAGLAVPLAGLAVPLAVAAELARRLGECAAALSSPCLRLTAGEPLRFRDGTTSLLLARPASLAVLGEALVGLALAAGGGFAGF